MVAATARPASGSPRDFCLIKFGSSGESPLWTKTIGSGDDVCHSGRQTTDGGYILCGSTATPGDQESRLFLVKTDPDGDIE